MTFLPGIDTFSITQRARNEAPSLLQYNPCLAFAQCVGVGLVFLPLTVIGGQCGARPTSIQ